MLLNLTEYVVQIHLLSSAAILYTAAEVYTHGGVLLLVKL